jgi:hypothetical protein
MDEYKSSEVTFKYYLPENKDDLFLHVNASKMYLLLRDIDGYCREIVRREPNPHEERVRLAEYIRDMISYDIDLDEVS